MPHHNIDHMAAALLGAVAAVWLIAATIMHVVHGTALNDTDD